jgi:hypothetical protein
MANTNHSLYPELKSMVAKVMGIDQVIAGIVARLGDVERAYLIDDCADGKDTGIIDIVLVGDIDQYHLNDLCRKTEKHVKRKIRILILKRKEFASLLPELKRRPNILLWKQD